MTLRLNGNQLLIRHLLVFLKRLTKIFNPPETPPLMIIFWWHPTLTTYHIVQNPPPSLYYILQTLPSNSSIMEFMQLDEIPSKHHHHQSFFLPSYQMVEYHFETLVSYDIVTTPQSPVLIHNVEFEGNLSNITNTVSVDI